MTKPTAAEGYSAGLAAEARRMCLYVATILGDLSNDIVVVGGLVPYLIVDQQAVEVPHVGTRDLDLGLALALLDEERYRQVSARLRDRGFQAGTKAEGQVTRQTWILPTSPITLDFLISRSGAGPEPGRLQNLEGDFAAVVTPALGVAFQDFIEVIIDDLTLNDERAKRSVKVCGPAAFVVMKAHAFRPLASSPLPTSTRPESRSTSWPRTSLPRSIWVRFGPPYSRRGERTQRPRPTPSATSRSS